MLFFPENKMFFRFLVLIQACTAFPFQCPDPAQWSIRARGLCPNPSKYSCLKNDLVNGYSENCTISDFQAPGRKGVLRGGLDADICSKERYHPWPIKYYTNVSTNCIFLKSVCNEEGQVVYGNGNHNTDITCRCDYTRGYDFIGKPRNPCYCVPSEEDCSCYLKACIDQTYFLSPDTECINTKMNTTTANCAAIYKESVSKEQNDSNTTDTKITEHILTPVQRKLYSRLIVIAFCIGFILVYCLYELMEKSSCKGTTLVKISHTAEEKDVEHNIHKADEIKLPNIFDKETPKIQIEESEKKDFDLLATQALEVYDQQNRDRVKVPDWMTKVFKEHEIKEKKYFVNTTAIKCVMNYIHQHECVSVIGPSGVGKTFLVYHVALEMEKIGYTILKVDSPKQIKKHYISDNKLLFVVDDMCGNYTANTEKLEEWKSSMNDITEILDKNMCKLILTCRLQVFQDEEFTHSKFKLFHECICNLVDKKHALTFSEKQQLAKMYFKNTADEKLKPIFQYNFFPVLCQLYDRRDISNFSEDAFLKDPFAFYKVELDNLYHDCKYKFVALLLLVVCNNRLQRKDLTNKEDKVLNILWHIREECPIKQFTISEFNKELEVLTQTFVVNDNGTYHTIHDKLFDFLAYYFGKRYNQLIIKHADMDFLNARCSIIDKDESHKNTREDYVIGIEDDNLQLYTERVFNDKKQDEQKYIHLWFNRNVHNETFQNTLCAMIEKLKKEEISNLIETSSSKFVRNMFVMDVKDIKLDSRKLDERFGIVLEKVHLEECTERMFVDMTKSDDVKNYMKRCRCCKNETFIDYLLTYMTSLRSPAIKELIKSASSSFVQLMFVMEKDDIMLRTPHVYKRYGIVISDDVIQIYIERVFDDISNSEDVSRYMKGNRNKANAKFQTRLLDYMTQLDLTTIEQLIKKASASFIYELCVMTTDDIDTISYNECQRYGVIIPDKYIQMYVDRWFNEMTKSYHISQYFEGNRNKQVHKFKTILLTYMSELQDETIEKLIKTASKDFLHKLFVTTKEDIKHDSINEWEQYGIVLQDKYLDMYTLGILDPFRLKEYLKCNRTIERILKCMSHFDPSNITKLIYASDEDIFHQWITVDIGKELRIQNNNSDCQCPSLMGTKMLEMKEGPINCPLSLIGLYMDRMISDWGQGKLLAVFSNNNLKNQSFVEKFLKHLNQLEPSKISELLNINDGPYESSTLKMICLHGEVNLAKWCLENYLHENLEQNQEHNRLFALFLLVVFNNQLDDSIISDELIKTTDMKFSFRKMLNIREDISARVVKNELNTSLNRTVVEKLEGVYSAIYGKVFPFLVFYFASIRKMSTVLVEYADEKLLFEWFLLEKSLSHQNYFIIPLADEEFHTCINRVFTKIKNSEKFIKYILEGYNQTNFNSYTAYEKYLNEKELKKNVSSLTAYVKNLNKKEIKTIFENSCIHFINKFFVLSAIETKDMSDEEPILTFEIPDTSIHVYIKRIFDHISSNDCVESCLQDNRNKKTEIFRTKLSSYMKDLKIDDKERLIKLANSDFISRMFVISEKDIKDESYWEYERYGIVVPDGLLQSYIKRVFSDTKDSVFVPVNRNSENKTFQNTFNSYTSSFSETTINSLLDTASSTFIRRMFLSTEDESVGINTQIYENYHRYIPKKYFRAETFKTYSTESTYILTSLMEDDLSTFTIITREDRNCEDTLIRIKSKMRIDSLQQLLSKYIDPMLTSKIMLICIRLPKGLVGKYMQRMVAEWMNGHIHDVFGNINLGDQSFRRRFHTHLKNIEHSTQTQLIDTTDNLTGDSTLVVSCHVGSIELVKWCLDHNASTNSHNKYKEHPLYIACNQNRSDIVYSLLHAKDKVGVNKASGKFKFYPLNEACKNGNEKIVSMLLMENADVNVLSHRFIKESPLQVACKYGHIEIVSLLLEHNINTIDVDTFFRWRNPPLYIACKRGHTQIVSLLLNHDADMEDMYNEQKTPLYAACKGGYTDIVILLLARDFRVINKSRFDGASLLWVACSKGHVEVVSTLLDHKNIEIDKCLLIGMSPLFIASSLGHTKIVKTLLKRRADAYICVMNKDNVLQVFERFERKYPKYITNLVIENASKHVKSYIDGKEEGWVLNSILGASPLHMGSLMGHIEIVKLLIKSNSNINCASDNGSTPLILACELGHENIVNELLTNGADLTLNRKDGKSPFTIAKDNGHIQIVEIIKSQPVESLSNLSL
ncbi:uncharacterized protein [Mytilus edulis]|uniref:uncharacterized protein n=1 Tax=Mytilus edulis TaxID=6550 RepID=UPI0039F04B2A